MESVGNEDRSSIVYIAWRVLAVSVCPILLNLVHGLYHTFIGCLTLANVVERQNLTGIRIDTCDKIILFILFIWPRNIEQSVYIFKMVEFFTDRLGE